MSECTLSRLEPVDLETVWDNEPAQFTPWLTKPDNLRFLGDALEFELELEGQEMPVGPFRADIVCRDARTGARVLIENQLNRSDHVHLGQTFTYAAGLEAAAVVWLARRFTDEHRAALDWLNRIADGEVRFFGLEIELWRIDDSPAAPRFNVVARPNPGAASPGVRATSMRRNVKRGLRLREYWAGVLRKLDSAGGPVAGNRRPSGTRQMIFRAGRYGFNIVASTTPVKRHVRVQLSIWGEHAEERFGLLERQKEEIERELGYPLEWEARPRERDCKISCGLLDADPEDEADWPRQHEWLAQHVNDMHRVFSRRVKAL